MIVTRHLLKLNPKKGKQDEEVVRILLLEQFITQHLEEVAQLVQCHRDGV